MLVLMGGVLVGVDGFVWGGCRGWCCFRRGGEYLIGVCGQGVDGVVFLDRVVWCGGDSVSYGVEWRRVGGFRCSGLFDDVEGF